MVLDFSNVSLVCRNSFTIGDYSDALVLEGQAWMGFCSLELRFDGKIEMGSEYRG